MSGFSSIVGLSKVIADTLYEAINAVSTHAGLTTTHGGALQTAAMKNVASGIAGLGDSGLAPHVVSKAASANNRHSFDGECVVNQWGDYKKVKTITFSNGLRGIVRVLFDLKSNNAAYTVYGKIYKNGVAFGTEQSTDSIAYVTKSEDLSVSLNAGNTLELWLKDTGNQALTINFRIAYDDLPVVAVDSANS